MNKIMSEIQALQEVVTRFRQMRLDATEFACLKCIVTFKAGECMRVSNILSLKYIVGHPPVRLSKVKLLSLDLSGSGRNCLV